MSRLHLFVIIPSFISASWYFGDTWVIGPVLIWFPFFKFDFSLHLFQSWFSVLLVIFPHSASLHWPQEHRERCSIYIQPHCRHSGIIFDLQKWPVFIPPSSEDSGWPQRSGSPQRHWWDGPQISEANCTTEVIWSHFIKERGEKAKGNK